MDELVIENNDIDDRELEGEWLALTEDEFNDLIEIGDKFELYYYGVTVPIRYKGFHGTCSRNEMIRTYEKYPGSNKEILLKSLCKKEDSCNGDWDTDILDNSSWDIRCPRTDGLIILKPTDCKNFNIETDQNS